MLSNKMTVSLMSLITIIALAFVAPSAMAQNFDVNLDMTGDVSTADNLQVRHPGTSLTVTFEAAKAIVLPDASVFVTTYDDMGKLVSIPAAEVTPATAAKMLMVTIPVDASIVKVNIKINEGIVAADPLDTEKSKKVDVTIDLVGGDAAAGPTVYSIRRAADPLLPVTADTFQVIITLSEMAKEFKKGNVRISDNATITKDPEALEPVREITATRALANATITRTFRGVPPVVRGLYNNDFGGTVGTVDIANGERGIHGLIAAITGDAANAEADDTTANAIPAAGAKYSPPSLTSTQIGMYETTILSTATAFERAVAAYNAETGATSTGIALLGGTGTGTVILPVDMPSTAAWPVVAHPTMVAINYTPDSTTAKLAEAETTNLVTFSGVNAATFPGDAPDPLDFETLAAYNLANQFHAYKMKAKAIYTAGVAVKTAYDAAVAAVEALDNAAADAYLNLELDATQGDAPAIQLGTGRDNMLYPYVVTIAPKYANKDNIVIKAGAFEDTVKPIANKYIPPDQRFPALDLTEGVNMLTVKVGREDLVDKDVGFKFALPKDKVIPAGGYLVVAEDKAGSAIHVPGGDIDKSPAAHQRNARERLYNVIDDGDLPNLETFLVNGGVIDVMGPQALVITEVMWGSDESLADVSNSQWIELYNAGAEYKTQDGDNTTYLIFYQPGDTLPAATTVKDRIGTIDATGTYWGNQLPGQRGRTGTGEAAGTLLATHPTEKLVSMNRVMAAGTVADGQMLASWAAHTEPAVNFSTNAVGVRVGSPGAERLITAAETAAAAAAAKAKAAAAAAAAAKAADTSVMMPKVGQIYISEIMFAGGGTLPQWIEISNGSRSEEVNLSGWTLTVDNAAADTDVSVGATATFTIPEGTKIDPSGQHDTPSTILVVTEKGRNNLTGADASGQVLNLSEDNEVELILAGVVTGKYTLLSDMAFMITLAPPEPEATKPPATETVTAKATRQAAEKKAALERKAATDMVGNLGTDGAAAWALPMNMESGRSSIIRRHVQVTRGPAAPENGTMMDSWALASDTSFAQVTHIRASSYYGAANDVGTPGFRAGGALPVELSSFSPARDKVTDAVVITWSTQSELNNAGFFIKRSQQRDGEFKVINATMVPGAGTTSEKQFYTYTDTTAQPNVVYYYQIEDVSLDGNRQTLTRGIRLKGHVGAAGKATTTWGDLKTSNE